jgi:hypothetical protein
MRGAGALFGEKAGLGGGSCGGGFAAGDSDDAQDGEFGKSRAGNEDAIGIGVEIGRSDLEAVIEEVEEVVGDDPFETFAVGITEADPETVELGTAEEGFALGFEVAFELADEIDAADFGKRDLLVLAIGGEEIKRVGLTQAAGIEIAARGFPVGKDDDDLLMGRGWGFGLQSSSISRRNVMNLRFCAGYVKLGALFLSTYCFYRV